MILYKHQTYFNFRYYIQNTSTMHGLYNSFNGNIGYNYHTNKKGFWLKRKVDYED